MDSETFERVVWIKAHFESGKPKLGSGFRLDSKLVLTVRHVIEARRDGAVEPALRIQVFPRCSKPEDEASDRFDASHLSAGAGDVTFDVAILRVDHLPEIRPFQRLVWGVGDPRHCRLIGFPTCTAAFRDRREPWSVRGELTIANPESPDAPLTFAGNAPDAEKGAASWAGISGAPLFLEDKPWDGGLYGIVRSTPKDFGDKLLAVSVPILLQSEQFRKLLGLDTESASRSALRAFVYARLKDGRVVAALRTVQEAWDASILPEGASAFLDQMLDADIGLVMSGLDEVGEAHEQVPAVLVKLQELALSLAALMIDARLELPADGAGTGTWLRLRVAGIRETEAVLAAAADQPPSYDYRDPRVRPVPKLMIPAPSLAGAIGPTLSASDAVDEVEFRQVKTIDEPEKSVLSFLENDVDRYPFLPEDVRAELNSPSSLDPLMRRAKWVNAMLVQLARKHKRPHYLVQKANDQSMKSLTPLLNELSRWLPGLQSVVIDDDEARAIEIETQLLPLWTLLRRGSGRQET